MSIIDILKGDNMNEQTNSTQETVLNEETQQEIGQNGNAEQTPPEESGSASGTQKSEQVDFAQMYDMLTERDNTIKELKSEIADLKKTNTQLLVRVNASPSTSREMKNPYEKLCDAMGER